MSRIKLLLALIEDIRAIADDLQTIAEVMTSSDPGTESTTEATQKVVSTEKIQPEVTIRLEDIRAVLAAKSRDGYGAQVRELIAKHGGSKLSDIDSSEYATMLKETEAFGHAT